MITVYEDLRLDQSTVETLDREFAVICGDTFCEGDDGDLTPLALTCSVARPSGRIGQCVWTFAGSTSDVDPATGRIVVTSHVFSCDLGVKGSARDLRSALERKGPLLTTVRLPGADRTIYDTLTSCL